MKLVHFLYDSDILSETTIIKWYNQAPDTSPHGAGDSDEEMDDKHAELRKQVWNYTGCVISCTGQKSHH